MPVANNTPITIICQLGNDSQLDKYIAHKKNVIHVVLQ